MKKEMVLLLLIVLCMSEGCRNKNGAKVDNKVATIYPLDLDVIDDFGKYIDTVEVIPLETGDSSYVAHVNKMLRTKSGNFLISTVSSILMFDSGGKYISTIGEQGRGEGEYVGLGDLCLSDDEKELMVLTGMGEVIKYSLPDGKFMGKVTPQFSEKHVDFESIAPAERGGFFLLTAAPNSLGDKKNGNWIIRFQADGQQGDTLLPVIKINLNVAMVTQGYNNQYLIRPAEGDNVCYIVKEGKISPYVKIDFRDKQTLKDYAQGKYRFDIQRYMCSDECKFPVYFHHTADQVYFAYAGPGGRNHYCLYSFPDARGIVWKNEGDMTPFLEIVGSDSTSFYGVYNDYADEYSAGELKSLEPLKRNVLERTHIKLGEKNPALVRITFKY